ncbi:hypothetical protein IKF02_03415 [Candidatus Saccharibacteria bacterium]|nr:hypothetical protein [Candidatus Saccharibacteria bacterium]
MKRFLFTMIVLVASLVALPVFAISDSQEKAIVDHCDSLRDSLKSVQRDDSRARVYLGRYYENILNKFITPLNVRLVENNLSNSELISNQNDFAKTRTNFMIDYVEYQKELEDLVATNCKEEPGLFYEKLVSTRKKRELVAKDADKLRSLALNQIDDLKILEGRL